MDKCVPTGLDPESVCGRLHDILLLLWLVASPSYRTAKCQPSSPCGNNNGKCSEGRFASLICSNSPTRWCPERLFRPPHYRPSKMAATSLQIGYQLPGLTNRTLKTLFLINSPARRNISTTFSTRFIVTTISLSKASVTPRRIRTGASISLSKTYKGQVRLAPEYILYI
jgi:hypothetical protein